MKMKHEEETIAAHKMQRVYFKKLLYLKIFRPEIVVKITITMIPVRTITLVIPIYLGITFLKFYFRS